MTRLAIAVIGACALTLAAAPAADALIQVDHGIAGVRISNTRAEVRAALGKPAKSKTGADDAGNYVQYTYAGGIVVTFQGEDRVSSVSTTGLGDRTAKGVGVGSTEAQVKSGVAGIKCETIAGGRICHTGRLAAGRKVTAFVIGGDGKVSRVDVGQVID
jgi:hypothetical protein